MRSGRFKLFLLLPAVALIAVLCGCSSTSAEDFYALPQLSQEYVQLQEKIDEVLEGGAEYSAPISGSNRQAVQLEDIDGNGEKEAVAFFQFIGSDRPQRIYIYRNVDGIYEEAAHIEGEGSGIESISYTDMDGDGIMEIAVGWQIASGMNILTVYTMKDFQPVMLLNTDYTEYVTYDLTDDGCSNIVLFRLSTSETGGEAVMYTLSEEGEMIDSTVLLSSDMESLKRIRTGKLIDGTPSILIEGVVNGSSIITDILACRNGAVRNITLNDTTGSSGTVRNRMVYCRDINGDDVLDVPKLIDLPSQTEGTAYYLTEWYSYRVSGRSSKICTTYMNYTDYWYFVIPEEWADGITVRRQDVLSGERTVIFSYSAGEDDEEADFLAIYTLSGDNREERSTSGGRFMLAVEDETIFSAEILDDSLPGISEEQIKDCFDILYSEWQTGEM